MVPTVLTPQINIVFACTILHNFIKTEGEDVDDWVTKAWDKGLEEEARRAARSGRQLVAGVDFVEADPHAMDSPSVLREQIATQMWTQYLEVLSSRRELPRGQ